jgi:hypothetical protein
MHDVHFIAIRVAQVGAIISVSIMWARSWLALINTSSAKASGIGRIDCLRMWRGKSHHAAISRGGLFKIVGAVNIEARQGMVGVNPACGRWPSIRAYNPTAKAQGSQYRFIEGSGPIEIVCPYGDMTEHPVFLLTKTRRYRVILWAATYSRCCVELRERVSARQSQA